LKPGDIRQHGIALALICAACGYPFRRGHAGVVLGRVERCQIMRGFGAKVVLSPAAARASGAVRRREARDRGRLVPRTAAIR
jgi:cysteine synthase